MVADFGSAKVHATHAGQATTRGGGTEGWQSPEVIVGDGATTASDIFSLGLIFYFVLTRGHHPFGEDPRKRGKAMMRFAITDEDDADDADESLRLRVTEALRDFSTPPAAAEAILPMLRLLPGSRPSVEDVLKSRLLLDGCAFSV